MIRAVADGRLGGDPVQRATRNGGAMVTASLAVNAAKAGENPVTEWIGLVAFGAVAECLAGHVKGDVVTALGSLTKSNFTGRDGQQRSSWSLVAEAILSARAVCNDRPRERRDTSAATRSRGDRASGRRSVYSAPKQPGSSPDLPNDRVDDLYADGLVP
jgi:single-strand DNA-binding protein